MKSRTFDGVPERQLQMSHEPNRRIRRAEGTGQGWPIPVTIWEAVAGYGEETEVSSLGNSHLAIVLAGRVKCLKGGAQGKVADSHSELVTVFRRGDPCLFVAPGPVRFAHLHFTEGFWRSIAEELHGTEAARAAELRADHVFTHAPALRAMTDSYLRRAFDANAPSRLEMDSRAVLIGIELVEHHASMARRARTAPTMAPQRIGRALDYIEAHLAESIGLNDLARTAELSPYHFARVFKLETGLAPHRYVLDRRVERAQRLLASTDRPLHAIALECGFSDQSHFGACFRRATGRSPGAWRRAFARDDRADEDIGS